MSRAMYFCPLDHQGASGGISLADTALGWTFTSIIRVVCSVFFWLHHQKKSVCSYFPISDRVPGYAHSHRPQWGGCCGPGLPCTGSPNPTSHLNKDETETEPGLVLLKVAQLERP